MSEPAAYIIAGPLPAAGNRFSAEASALAAALSTKGPVVFVHDDMALPPDTEGTITYIRSSDFEHNLNAYHSHRRIYCLGNHYSSLFAYGLLQKYPGLVITEDGSYHDLILGLFQSGDNWAEHYAGWLAEAAGDPGRIIGETLLQHRRLSGNIGREIMDRTPLALERYASITLAADQLFPFTYSISTQAINKSSAPTEPTDPESAPRSPVIACAGLDPDTLSAVNNDFENLGAQTRLLPVREHPGDMVAHISAAAGVVLAANGPPSALLSTCLKAGKALVVAGSAWDRVLLPGACLKVEHPAARHQLVAAIGALAGNPDLKSALQKAARQIWQDRPRTVSVDTIISLCAQQPALEPHNTKTKATAARASETAKQPALLQVPQQLLEKGACVPTALIGSVPAPHLLAALLPGIDPDRSPRFATPALANALAKKLAGHGPQDASSLLAHLGFETPIIRETGDTAAPDAAPLHHVHDWATVKQGLRRPDSAITLNAIVDGIPQMMSGDSQNPGHHYGIEISFTDSLAPFTCKASLPLFDAVSGYLEKSGLFWELDKARHVIRCLMIVGLKGTYSLSARTLGDQHNLIVADAARTQRLKAEGTALRPDENGILAFTLCAQHAGAAGRTDSITLLKLLAQTPLKLEWSSYD